LGSDSYHMLREQKYRDILKELNNLIIECDDAWIIKDVYGNARLTGHAADEIIGKDISFIFQSQPILDRLKKTSLSPEPVGGIIRAKFHPDSGPPVNVAVSMSRIKGEGPRHSFVLTVRDITNKLLLARQNRQMAVRMRENEKLAYLGSMVQGLTHNLLSPLTAILGRAEMLSLKYTNERDLEDIIHTASTMGENIRTLLAKIAGERQSTEQELDINDILRAELRVLEANLFFKHKIKKEYHFEDDLPKLRGIYGDFSQSFTNIIKNAIDAMKESQEKKLAVATGYDKERIMVLVADTGCGIEKKHISKIFESNFSTKVHKIGNSDEDLSGMGLGLASVKELMSHYGVTFDVKSTLNKGTVFRLYIPYEEEDRVSKQEMRERMYARLSKVIQDLENLPTIPNILYEIIDATRTEVSFGELSQFVEKDYALAGKIFTIVNSAYYGLMRPITTILRAISYLGMEEVRDICFGLLSQQVLVSSGPKALVQRLWSHSLAAAIASRHIMLYLGQEIEFGYLTALLHDIGKIILLSNYKKLALERPKTEPQNLISREEEQEMFGLTHDLVGGVFFNERTILPAVLSEAIMNHHGSPDPEAHELTRLLMLSNNIAHNLDKSEECPPETVKLAKLLWGFTPDDVRRIMEESGKAMEFLKECYKIEF
jgi:PAS domain S-box-containing protein